MTNNFSLGFAEIITMMTAVADHRKGLSLNKKKKRSTSVESSNSSSNDPMSPERRDYKRKFKVADSQTTDSDRVRVQSTYEAVAAIDFGTTYSGYAYAFTRDPDNVHLMNQRIVSHRSGYGVQQPTVLLLNKKGEFHSFGYDAQEFFHDLDEEESGKWLYFEKFKMALHSREVSVPITNTYNLHCIFLNAACTSRNGSRSSQWHKTVGSLCICTGTELL